MTINIIDTTTPLVGLKAGAEVYNANFTDANNAASKEVGTLPDNVPTNADLPTFGTAAEKDTGTAAGQVPLNSDLPAFGTAATKDAQTGPTDTTPDRALMTDALDEVGNVWGASNVEYGSNANGEYWKYPDGSLTCILTGTAPSGSQININLGYYYRSDNLTWTFPYPFIANPVVNGNSIAYPIRTTPISLTQANYGLLGFDGTHTTSSDTDIYLLATGRWK